MAANKATEEITLTLSRLEDWESAASTVLDFAGNSRKFLFYGEVGAGKTTFIKAICQKLGVADTVQSPTFSLINEYHSDTLQQPVFHIDLYRLRQVEEALDIGMIEQLDHPWFTFIEWPELIEDFVEGETISIHIKLMENSTRKIVILKHY